MRKLEGHAFAGTLRQLASVIPIRHVSHGLQHASSACRVEGCAEAGSTRGSSVADRAGEQIQPILQWILPRSNSNFVDERLHDERNTVGAWRAQCTGRNVEWRNLSLVNPEVLDESTREFICRNDGSGAVTSHVVTERGQLSGCIEGRLEVVIAGWPVVVMTHVVFT